MKRSYSDLIKSKERRFIPCGIRGNEILSPKLFEFQDKIIRWALKTGRCAIWADCGLGKTWMALEWSRIICEAEKKPIIILTPLAVAAQFKAEGQKIGVDVTVCREYSDVRPGINCINYERLHKIDCSKFVGVVLDESSILKDYTSATRNKLIDEFARTPYRLACTATPAPNDVMELGNHSQFLSAMSRTEMLSMYFVHDGGETQKWRLKRHARGPFWKWVSTWATAMTKPSDLGYDDSGYELPPLSIDQHVVKADHAKAAQDHGTLFYLDARTLSEQRQARRDSLPGRVKMAAEMINASDQPWIVWCDLNIESEAAVKAIDGAVEIRGSNKLELKEQRVSDFTEGRTRVLVTKPSICGHGLNWQHCANVVFLGVSHSFEQWYQAIRRVYRFGQRERVNCHIITGERESNVLANLERKRAIARDMIKEIGSYAKL